MLTKKKSTSIRPKRHHGCYVVMKTLMKYRNDICDIRCCDAIANIYEEMVLKSFINTIAKSYVKR